MTIVITRDVADRFRGFLASCMLELAPGVYSGPRMSQAVRARVWGVLEEWFSTLGGGGILMTWPDTEQVGGQSFLFLGEPKKELVEYDGLYLTRRDAPPDGPPDKTAAESRPR
jgi:CRISPR-associated protein Cas2